MEFLGMVEILKEETPVSWRVPVSWKKILFDEVQNKIIIPGSITQFYQSLSKLEELPQLIH